jgi:hypothetical protein
MDVRLCPCSAVRAWLPAVNTRRLHTHTQPTTRAVYCHVMCSSRVDSCRCYALQCKKYAAGLHTCLRPFLAWLGVGLIGLSCVCVCVCVCVRRANLLLLLITVYYCAWAITHGRLGYRLLDLSHKQVPRCCATLRRRVRLRKQPQRSVCTIALSTKHLP